MSTLSVCSDCRETCAKCNSHANSSHPVWSCNDCKHKFGSNCPVCGGPKGRSGNTGAGRVCNKCFKINTCTFCGKKI